MKKTLLTLLAVFTLSGVAMAQGTAKKVEGSYKGDLVVTLMGESQTVEAQNVEIRAEEGDTSVTFSLYDFAFIGIPLGDIVLEGVAVSETAGDSVVFGDKDPENFKFDLYDGEELVGSILATAKINAGKSSVKADVLDAVIDVVWLNVSDDDPTLTAPIDVHFTGTKQIPEGINAVRAEAKQAGVYTLSGVRVADSRNLPKGIYIVNGKKIIK